MRAKERLWICKILEFLKFLLLKKKWEIGKFLPIFEYMIMKKVQQLQKSWDFPPPRLEKMVFRSYLARSKSKFTHKLITHSKKISNYFWGHHNSRQVDGCHNDSHVSIIINWSTRISNYWIFIELYLLVISKLRLILEHVQIRISSDRWMEVCNLQNRCCKLRIAESF